MELVKSYDSSIKELLENPVLKKEVSYFVFLLENKLPVTEAANQRNIHVTCYVKNPQELDDVVGSLTFYVHDRQIVEKESALKKLLQEKNVDSMKKLFQKEERFSMKCLSSRVFSGEQVRELYCNPDSVKTTPNF